jgi:hypothetical protein
MHPLRAQFDELAHGRFPPPDGQIDVLPAPDDIAGAVIGLTGHLLVAAAVDPAACVARFGPGDFSNWLAPATTLWLGEQISARPMTHDALFCRIADGSGVPDWLHLVDAYDHPRVDRATRYRDGNQVFVADDDEAVLIIGRGLAGRWEVGFEVAPGARTRGLGRKVAAAAVAIVPAGEPIWAQVAPGNAASMRAVAAAGYRPMGSEVLFVAADQ